MQRSKQPCGVFLGKSLIINYPLLYIYNANASMSRSCSEFMSPSGRIKSHPLSVMATTGVGPALRAPCFGELPRPVIALEKSVELFRIQVLG